MASNRLVVESLCLKKPSFCNPICRRGASRQLISVLGSGVVFTYLILTSSLEARAIAQARSPDRISAKLPTAEFGVGWPTPDLALDWELKSEVLSDRTLPNPAPDAASIGSWDGIYLYGESPKPDEIKKEYFVFEVRRGKLIGAFYLPRSAFYCFYGTLELTQLHLTVVDSFDGTTSPYSVNLQQYHPIPTVSDNDRRILGVCKAAHQDQVWGK